MSSHNTPTLLNTEQAAQFLGLSASTLAKWRVYGTGPKFVKLSSAVRYQPADLSEWLTSRACSSTSQVVGSAA